MKPIYGDGVDIGDAPETRRHVFQRPNPFPLSSRNVAFRGANPSSSPASPSELVESSLPPSALERLQHP